MSVISHITLPEFPNTQRCTYHVTALHLIFFWIGFEQTYPQSSFTHLGYRIQPSRGVKEFLLLSCHCYPPFTWDQPPDVADAVLCSALQLCPSPPAALLPRTVTGRKWELSRLYLPPKPTSQGASFASLVTSRPTILLMVPSNQLLQSSRKTLNSWQFS